MQHSSNPQEFMAENLDTLESAVQLNAWIISHFKPYLGAVRLDVGCGRGTMSQHLVNCDQLYLVEPNVHSAKHLESRFAQEPHVQVIQQDFFSLGTADFPEGGIDSIFCSSVLEHLGDDEATMNAFSTLLKPGGHACIYVPALSFLFSDFDKNLGHFRRYNKSMLRKLSQKSGLKLVRLYYCNLIGIAGWYWTFKIRKKSEIDASLLRLYDRHIIPISRFFESIIRPPMGQNLVAVFQKQA